MIITNEERLRVKCTDADSSEFGHIIFSLENELYNSTSPGIGLAAPQIGIAKNVAIIRLQDYSLNLVNSKIISASDPKMFQSEGCLSFPGRTEDTRRFQKIELSNNNDIINLQGLAAVAVQHELDHLQGILFFDHKIINIPFVSNKIDRNSICPCGSGKKFKKCCYPRSLENSLPLGKG